MSSVEIVIIIAVVLVLGIIIFPLVNRRSFRRLAPEQQVRVIMKQAKGLIFFKNVSNGRNGTLYYVKNKRKILELPWVLYDGNMLCTRNNPFERWDYPEEKELLTDEELEQLKEELDKYNKKTPVKIIFKSADKAD